MKCRYCGNNNNKNQIGIDRIDSDGDYTVNNTVPSCGICNMMKNTTKQDEFVNKCRLIANIHKKTI